MKPILILITALMLISIVSAYYVCRDDTDNDNIPCDVVTPIIEEIDCGPYNTASNNYTSNLTNLNSSVSEIVNMTPVGDGTYNFTFSYNEIGLSYSIVTCANSTATLNVVADEDPDINLWLILFTIFFLLLIFGYVYRTAYIGNIFIFTAGCEILLMAIWVFQSGISIYGTSVFWIFPYAWILAGIGIILIISSIYNYLSSEEGDY